MMVVGKEQDVKRDIESAVPKEQVEGESSSNTPLHGGENLVNLLLFQIRIVETRREGGNAAIFTVEGRRIEEEEVLRREEEVWK